MGSRNEEQERITHLQVEQTGRGWQKTLNYQEKTREIEIPLAIFPLRCEKDIERYGRLGETKERII